MTSSRIGSGKTLPNVVLRLGDRMPNIALKATAKVLACAAREILWARDACPSGLRAASKNPRQRRAGSAQNTRRLAIVLAKYLYLATGPRRLVSRARLSILPAQIDEWTPKDLEWAQYQKATKMSLEGYERSPAATSGGRSMNRGQKL
jgi:hypothetical protein